MNSNSSSVLSSSGRGSGTFSSPGRGSGTIDFLNSNSLIARTSFILLIVFVSIILIQIISTLIAWLYQRGDSPRILNGMIDGTHTLVIPQNPNSKSAIPIDRSINAPGGLEFTWSVWLFVKDTPPPTYNRHIFHKGNPDIGANGMVTPNNGPGLYLSANTNDLVVAMSTYNNINEDIIIEDIPLNKWFNVMIRLTQKTLDLYINGKVTKSIELDGVPKQNYGDVFLALNNGFEGFISNLWYFNYALSASEIYNIVQDGPNTKMASDSAVDNTDSKYLSLRWYFFGQGNQYNPV